MQLERPVHRRSPVLGRSGRYSTTALPVLRCAQLQQLEALLTTPTTPKTLPRLADGGGMTPSEAGAATAWALALVRVPTPHTRESQELVDACAYWQTKLTSGVLFKSGGSMCELTVRHPAKPDEKGMRVQVRYQYAIDESTNRRFGRNRQCLRHRRTKAQRPISELMELARNPRVEFERLRQESWEAVRYLNSYPVLCVEHDIVGADDARAERTFDSHEGGNPREQRETRVLYKSLCQLPMRRD